MSLAGLDPKLREILNQPIEMIELSSRASNCLKVARIRTIGELVGKRDEELLAVKNFGKKSLDEMKERLLMRGFILPESDPTEYDAEGADADETDTPLEGEDA